MGIRLTNLVVNVAATLLFLAIPSAASAVDIMLLGQGSAAMADFVSIDSSGCVTTSVHVEAGDFKFQNPPTQPIPLVGGGSVFILLSQLNTCTGESFDGVGGNQGVIDVALNHRLSEGTVCGTATIYEVGSGGSVISSFDVSVDLTWTGVGSQIRVNGDSEYRSGGFIVNTLNHADVRLATAVGTISDGTTNFTPTSSTNALIEWNTFHQVTVQCVSLRCQ